jgi:hypothetical protein
LRKRVKGLSLAEAEKLLSGDCKILREWIKEDSLSRGAGEFVAAFMDGFQFAVSESMDD